jgi:plastocyanin domain-containing protein
VRLGVRFEPASVVVPSGAPVHLRFRRDTAMAHGDAVIFPTLGRMATLPVGSDVDVTLPELAPGEYPFTASGATPCGTLVVEAP